LLWIGTFLHDVVEDIYPAFHEHHGTSHHFTHHSHESSAEADLATIELHVHGPFAMGHVRQNDSKFQITNTNNTVHLIENNLRIDCRTITEEAQQRPPPFSQDKFDLPIYLIHRRLLI
jgi:hypothetical protein